MPPQIPSGFAAQVANIFKPASSGSGLSSAMPFIGAGLDAAGGILGGLFNANQARKNRKFQERMYYQQLADNKALIEDARNYALPSAELQRLIDAGLNPLLYYGQNGASATLSPAQSAQAPHGAQAQMSMHTNFGQALLQSEMLEAQIRNINADTAQKEAAAGNLHVESDWRKLELQFSRDTYDVRVAIQHKNWEAIEVNLQKLRTDIVNSGIITSETWRTMRQAREYEVKRFNMDFDLQGQKAKQGWRGLELEAERNDIERERNKINWKMASFFAQRLVNETHMTDAQVGQLSWLTLKDKAMFGLTFEGARLDNINKAWDTNLKKIGFDNEQIKKWNGVLRNEYLREYGTETPEGGTIMRDVKGAAQGLESGFRDLYYLFTLPWQH